VSRDEEGNWGEKKTRVSRRGDHRFIKGGAMKLTNQDHQYEHAVALKYTGRDRSVTLKLDGSLDDRVC
jgi:hypothetical protein